MGLRASRPRSHTPPSPLRKAGHGGILWSNDFPVRFASILDTAVYAEAGAFQALHSEWHALLPSTAADTVFSTPEWLGSWWQVFGKDRPLHIVAFRQGAQLVGLAPLMRSVEDGHRCLCFIGGLDVSDYFDILVRQDQESATLSAFLDHIDNLSDWDVVDLHSVCDGSPTLTLLPNLARARGYAVSIKQEEVCPIIQLPASWDTYVDSLSKKDRHELRRKLRRLDSEAQGQWSWRTIRDAVDLPQALSDFFDLHAKSGAGKAEFWDQSRRAFFEANAWAMLSAGWLHLSFLELNGSRAAAIYAYDYGDAMSLYNSGYDPAHGYFSVGVLLVAFGVQEAIAAGKRRFDFLRGSEPYKYTFGAVDTAVFNLEISKSGTTRP
jgi:CelD/BcsL family acetyltransferase involved in cellulose biosynthesis